MYMQLMYMNISNMADQKLTCQSQNVLCGIHSDI